MVDEHVQIYVSLVNLLLFDLMWTSLALKISYLQMDVGTRSSSRRMKSYLTGTERRGPDSCIWHLL